MWKWNPEPHPTQVLRNVNYSSYWHTDSLARMQVQLTADTIQQLGESFNLAKQHRKPLTFFLVDDPRADWRKIESKHGLELYISQYSRSLFTAYDVNKISHLASNSVSSYYSWLDLPEQLRNFVGGI